MPRGWNALTQTFEATMPSDAIDDLLDRHQGAMTKAEYKAAGDEIRALILAERQRCARIAREGCLVEPDGGSPTEDEVALCEEIERRILSQ